ncbi:GntR family transcriptional regulator [Arthrobacter sp. M4]|uniref:GntR family transcriptional regulator n=1 Tax=Arthrobacter sp. M4 TaxID=218160 RepID=UPI001CDB85D4|nr:GntR family transcriptional regulator [Arthrobacter sp. M4]MCA4134514.1 GntR family transcriptional regulator [Arthrobacter sp. M4]
MPRAMDIPGSSPESPRGKAAAGEAYGVLRALILESALEPGERLNIDAIARRLEVSQTPVREALQRLEGDNLVVYTPGKGYSTTPLLGPEELRSLFEFRLLVEPWAARSAAVDRLANPGSALRAEIDSLEQSIDELNASGGGDIRQLLVAHDARFHDIVLEAVGNSVVRHAFDQTHCHLHTFRLYRADVSGGRTVEEHGEIASAIAACDAAGAEAAMSRHIFNSFDRFAQAYAGEPGISPLSRSSRPRTRLAP